MYSPTLGRWMQQDPMGYVDGGNLYQAYNSNSGIFHDPSGTRAVYYTAYIDTTTKPSEFNTSDVERHLNRLFKPVNDTLKKDQLIVRLIEEKKKPEQLGWWYYTTIYTLGPFFWRCNEIAGYDVWVTFTDTGLGYAQNPPGGKHITVRMQQPRADRGNRGQAWNWGIYFANIIAHEGVYHGALSRTTHEGSGDEFSSTNVPPTRYKFFDQKWLDKVKKKFDLE
jgi:hypothetical protein